ncbi:hypothetical protein BMS3Abin05_01508 [bacterium BMS3Abin05]|nr:hypothetical protein BMS3Abin05_01508 [bacterium BMS3Abin05]
MDGAGNQFFPCAAFASDKHGGIRTGNRANHIQNGLYPGAFSDNLIKIIELLNLSSQPDVFFGQFSLVHGIFDYMLQIIRIERLGHIIISAGLDGTNSGFNRSKRRNDNHNNIRINFPNPLLQLEAVHSGHLNVQ